MYRPPDVGKALDVWEKRIPERGERVVFLRGQLYDCERRRKLRSGQEVEYPVTARMLRLMLAAEGAEIS